MSSNKIRTIHLLLLDPSSNDAEHTINLLRNNGFAVRATQIVNEDELKTALEKQSWDMLITKPAVNDFTADKALRIIQHFQRDTPVLLLTDKYNGDLVVESLKVGMVDVVPTSELERVRLVVARELNNIDDRRKRKQAETALRETEKRCDLLLASSRDAIAYIHDGMHIYANKAYTELFGYNDPDELASMPVMDLIADQQQSAFREFLRDYASNAETNEFSFQGLHINGDTFDAVLTLSAAKYDGEECTQVLIRRGTDNAELEKRLKELSATDQVTGLFNRGYLIEKLDVAAERARKQEGLSALLLMEIDQFNQIKAKHGIGGTDELMRECAAYFRRKLDDEVLLARISDDCLAALVTIDKPDSARELGEKICREFAANMFEVEQHTVKATLSVGTIPIGEKAEEGEALISNAHAALILVKQKGGNGCKLFDPVLIGGSASEVDKKVLLAVQEALDSGRAYLLFQPVIKMHGAPSPMYSVLLRIKDEKGNHVSPDQVFPVAEQAGLAAKLDRWVITKATQILATYNGKERPRLFINLSASALIEESLPSFIGQNLRAARLTPDALIFQVDEKEAQEHLKRCINFLEGLKKVQGLSCLSNYGSTANSETLVRDLPVEFVRLDGSFAPQLASNQETQQKLQQLLGVAHSHNRRTLVPRVEDAGCLMKLYPLGVHYIQGYYLQAPLEQMNFDFNSTDF